MSAEENTRHADASGRFKEAWGRAHDDQGIELEGQLQQVDANSGDAAQGASHDRADTVRERSGEDTDPETATGQAPPTTGQAPPTTG